ncbi:MULTISPECIES: OsmC family protein [unclassified Paracoccus (in: a-proteobacteria)]|uniref:OsmC family protein n=1 Tax=unclassified Paracoccus (in: a-proteobacteria) TaxID=2688777 RepID=UPI0012B2F879|nr:MULTISPECIES: OsmC family protein [unclassified Paracoccus (in: a-proteobacteria)]UXU74838.1 OsmC family protein [Paracoccus sp. SMMA_5]UXU80736.1 OsmC family protein [Paracoccus sp. SMMA_5_TC]
MIVNSGSAKWQGGLKDGTGSISTRSGALSDQPYGFNTRFEGKPGTNPEELIGAAHAACFSMALSGQLAQEGITDVRIETTSEIGLDKDGDGFAIKTAHLVTRISATGDKAVIEECARRAEKGCPVSKLLNARITLDVTVL